MLTDFEVTECDINECPLCGSIDLWETPRGAVACHTCGTVIDPVRDDLDGLCGPVSEPVWWTYVEKEDFKYMSQAPYERPCICCKRRLGHTKQCEEINRDWHVMPWGKYKGKRMSIVPTGYLEFVAKRQFGSNEVRSMIMDELHARGIVIHMGIVDGID